MNSDSNPNHNLHPALDTLRGAKERYRIIAETVSDALITIDETSTILFINSAAERIFGHSMEEMTGKSLTMLMPEYLRHVHRAGIKRYLETGEKHISWKAVELPGLHKSGHEIPLELSFSEFNEDGRRFFTGIVRDITDRRLSERRLAAQYAVTRALSESDTLREAAPKILQTICENLDYEVGALWQLDRETNLLRCVETWHTQSMQEMEFETVTKNRTFSKGIGLPGRVWEQGEAAWVTDVVSDDNFPRAPFAKREGLHAAIAFPILLGSETLGVIEFFTREVRQPDEDLLRMMSTIGSQIGLFIERRRAESNLQASEQRYRYLADAMPQIVWTAQPDGYVDYYNQRWFDYTGLTKEQTEGWGWQPVLHPDDVERSLRRWARAVVTREVFEIEYRFRRASDVTYRWHLGRAVPMRDETGEIVKWFGTCTDIDDQKRAEEALRFMVEASGILASSLDYETTLKNVAQLSVPRLADWCVVHTIEEDGKLHQLAAAHTDPVKLELLREINHRYPAGLDSAHSYPLVVSTGEPELISEITDEALARVARDEEHLKLLSELGLKSTLCVPLRARGRTLGAITFATAESGRIYNESDLALAENLAHRAATAVDNARLYQEAQRANRAKDEFLATLSHELRTPLTPIIGWVHMIRGGMLKGDDMDRGLAVVEKNSQTLTRLINDLLDMSAIMSGKMRIEKVPVPLDAILKEAIETVRPSAERRGIILEVKSCSEGEVIINGDRTRLVQSFWNILVNAVKFSNDRGRVRVSCEADESVARVTVEDEGHGITPDFLPFVFERFRQEDSSKTRLHGGLGIGLALVKSFIEAHAGQVRAESDGSDRGSRFIIRLPRFGVNVTGEESFAAHAEASAARNKVNVLVVEDSPDTLELLHKALKKRGYNVKSCASAEEALRAASSRQYDIVISDIGMPETSGYELIEHLRLLPHMSDVPAIALSGHVARRDVEAALTAGFDAHITKPTDLATLIEEIERRLRRK